MKNIYFVQANNTYGTGENKTTYIPYAAGCIQAYCRQNQTIRENYRFGKMIYTRIAPDEVVNQLENPFMVFFSCSVWNTEYNKALAQQIKSRFPYCFITFGGHNISPQGEFLEKYPYIDFLTHRFGEEPTLELLLALLDGSELSRVANISYREADGSIITTEQLMQTGESYPSPYLNGEFDEILKDNIKFSGLFESNRGCPNGCAFCDWSSLKSKVRLFPMERVFAELDWFVSHKIEYIYCTDGNFCLFDRDAQIADYVVECKNKHGYPQIFKAFFTKNRYNFVFDVGTKFFNSGLDKAKTISFQSMNDEVLKNVGRRNISPEFFKSLMKKYNEINIDTFSELILGLPGETYESFCDGINLLIESGQHHAINIYPCELLPNSQMGQPEYKERFKIGSTTVPFKLIHSNKGEDAKEITEYSEYVTSTYSMDSNQWCNGLLFGSYIQALHNLGLTRSVAVYARHEHGIAYSSFYNHLIDYSSKKQGGLLNTVYNKIQGLCSGIISGKNEMVVTCDGYGNVLWGFDELIFLEFYKQLDLFYAELAEFYGALFPKTDADSELISYQQAIMRKIKSDDVLINSGYNFYSYFCKIYSGGYEKLKKEHISLRIYDSNAPINFQDFARETVWYGRNRRATDYTAGNYRINFE